MLPTRGVSLPCAAGAISLRRRIETKDAKGTQYELIQYRSKEWAPMRGAYAKGR